MIYVHFQRIMALPRNYILHGDAFLLHQILLYKSQCSFVMPNRILILFLLHHQHIKRTLSWQILLCRNKAGIDTHAWPCSFYGDIKGTQYSLVINVTTIHRFYLHFEWLYVMFINEKYWINMDIKFNMFHVYIYVSSNICLTKMLQCQIIQILLDMMYCVPLA